MEVLLPGPPGGRQDLQLPPPLTQGVLWFREQADEVLLAGFIDGEKPFVLETLVSAAAVELKAVAGAVDVTSRPLDARSAELSVRGPHWTARFHLISAGRRLYVLLSSAAGDRAPLDPGTLRHRFEEAPPPGPLPFPFGAALTQDLDALYQCEFASSRLDDRSALGSFRAHPPFPGRAHSWPRFGVKLVLAVAAGA